MFSPTTLSSISRDTIFSSPLSALHKEGGGGGQSQNKDDILNKVETIDGKCIWTHMNANKHHSYSTLHLCFSP